MIVYYNCDFAGGRDESRRLLKKAISEYLGDPDRAGLLVSGLRTGEHGKPFIDGFECFSVSHTGGIWAVLIDERECGMDIQLGKSCDVLAISRRLYAPEDAERIAELIETDEEEAFDEFFRLWTRREALAKAIGGSVYESDLPSVSVGDPAVDLKTYMLFDISFPEAETACGQKLYAAVCVEDVVGIAENTVLFSPI